MDMTGEEEVKESVMVRDSNRRISRETLESAYIWDSERSGKTVIVQDGNSVE